MAWAAAYTGEFLDIQSAVWRVEILRDTDGAMTAGDLTFTADQPLLVEWGSGAFEDPVWGSSATLKVISETDRQFISLYTIEAGTVRMDVYKDDALYWTGMLDPEFYEEPYERASGYEVSLTFTDFGILDRLKYALTGVQYIGRIIIDALERAGFVFPGSRVHFSDMVDCYVNLRKEAGGDISGLIDVASGMMVASENFIDEEGEVSTLREVLEGILQPLGLRLTQRGGRLCLFDLKGLDDWGSPETAVWAGDSQTLGVDKVYNSVTVTFSPYAQSGFGLEELSFDAPYDLSDINERAEWKGAESDDPKYWTFSEGDDASSYSFTIFASAKGSGARLRSESWALGEYAHILPIYGGAEECDCIPALFTTAEWNGSNSIAHGEVPGYSGNSSEWLFRLPRVRVQGVPDASERMKYYIRFVCEMLADCRYNPFDDDDDRYTDEQDALVKNSAYVGVPLYATIYDSESGGAALCHYRNNGESTGLYAGECWFDGEAAYGEAWLLWCDPDDLSDNGGGAGDGWQGNRQFFKFQEWHSSQMRARWRNADDGEYLPYPPQGGWLEIGVGNHLRGFRYGSSANFDSAADDWTSAGVAAGIRWVLFKGFALDLVRNGLTFDDADLEDVEYRGTLNESAQDDLSIDTVCGTADDAPPTARGILLSSDGSQVQTLVRDGVTDRPEKLLIGQLYSQYAGRKTTLSGEARIPSKLLMSENNQGDTRFILMADSEDIRMAVSEIEIREIGEDTYTGEED